MGKGDIKTKKGKRWRGSYGKTRRPKKKNTFGHPNAEKKEKKEKEAVVLKPRNPKIATEATEDQQIPESQL